VLPSGANLGDSVEIIDDKANLPSQTRITANTGQTIMFSGVGTTIAAGNIRCDNSVNGSIKLVYVSSNTWVVTNFNYYDSLSVLLPPTIA
jgi:hypothetical protein